MKVLREEKDEVQKTNRTCIEKASTLEKELRDSRHNEAKLKDQLEESKSRIARNKVGCCSRAPNKPGVPN